MMMYCDGDVGVMLDMMIVMCGDLMVGVVVL